MEPWRPVIQWTEPVGGILVWRDPIGAAQIRAGASLKVRESQTAALVCEAAIVEVYGPGLHNVNSGYDSPESEIYFFSTRPQMGLRWETATPVVPERKRHVIRIRGFGSYAYQITDPGKFYTKFSGAVDSFHSSDLGFHLRDNIAARIGAVIAGAHIALADLAANRDALAQTIADGIRPWFRERGLELYQFAVDSLSLFGDPDGTTRSQPVVTPASATDTKYCVRCGQALPKQAQSCWDCGRRQPGISELRATPIPR